MAQKDKVVDAWLTTQDEDRFGRGFLSDIVDWVRDNLDPDQVFTYAQLKSWAMENGLIDEVS
jgi:hypothetical protein